MSPSLTSVRRLRCRWHQAFRRFVSESQPPPAILRGSRNGAQRSARLAAIPVQNDWQRGAEAGSLHVASLRVGGTRTSRADGSSKSHHALVRRLAQHALAADGKLAARDTDLDGVAFLDLAFEQQGRER